MTFLPRLSHFVFSALLLVTSAAWGQGAGDINGLLGSDTSQEASLNSAPKEGVSAFDRSAKHGIQILADIGSNRETCYSDLLLGQIEERQVYHLYKNEPIVLTPALCRLSFVNVSRSNQIEIILDRLIEPHLISPISNLFTGFVLSPDTQLDILINPQANWQPLQAKSNLVNILGDTEADLDAIQFSMTFEKGE